jgi:hypothetical protein
VISNDEGCARDKTLHAYILSSSNKIRKVRYARRCCTIFAASQTGELSTRACRRRQADRYPLSITRQPSLSCHWGTRHAPNVYRKQGDPAAEPLQLISGSLCTERLRLWEHVLLDWFDTHVKRFGKFTANDNSMVIAPSDLPLIVQVRSWLLETSRHPLCSRRIEAPSHFSAQHFTRFNRNRHICF